MFIKVCNFKGKDRYSCEVEAVFFVVVEELRRPPSGVGSVACCVVVPARLVVGVWSGVLVVVEAKVDSVVALRRANTRKGARKHG